MSRPVRSGPVKLHLASGADDRILDYVRTTTPRRTIPRWRYRAARPGWWLAGALRSLANRVESAAIRLEIGGMR
jgi:hypothetical protein